MSSTLSNPVVVAQMGADLVSGATSSVVNQRETPTVGSGTAAGSVDLNVSKDITVATGTPLVLDLTSIADPNGNTVTFGHFCGYVFKNQSSTSAQKFTMGGGTNPVISALPDIEAGGHVSQYNPTGIVVDSTHKNLQFTVASGTSVAGRLTLLGRSV